MEIKAILEAVKQGTMPIEQADKLLQSYAYEDLGYAKVDHARKDRVGYPEVIFCQGKTADQVQGIVRNMLLRETKNILGTRASRAHYDAVRAIIPTAVYHELPRLITLNEDKQQPDSEYYIAVVTAGTSDIPVSEEAAVTAELFGNRVERIYDVGVAGIHRLFKNIEVIRGATAVIAVAGMEGALPSVLAGQVQVPVIAVPTSVGYGANFGGLSALLTMINSCAAGISVVNIDNGFGAGYIASMINQRIMEK